MHAVVFSVVVLLRHVAVPYISTINALSLILHMVLVYFAHLLRTRLFFQATISLHSTIDAVACAPTPNSDRLPLAPSFREYFFRIAQHPVYVSNVTATLFFEFFVRSKHPSIHFEL